LRNRSPLTICSGRRNDALRTRDRHVPLFARRRRRKNFAPDYWERLNIAPVMEVAGVDAPTDFAAYWLSVATGESQDYDGHGAWALIR
jgi:hypothetical protein